MNIIHYWFKIHEITNTGTKRGHCGCDRMAVFFIYNYLCNQCLSPPTLSSNPAQAMCTRYCIMDKVCQRLAAGQWFSLATPVFFTNKTDHHDITEILLIWC